MSPKQAVQSAALLPWLQENPGNRLLHLRSNAGTHDLPLAKQTLQQLISAGASGDAVPVVRYDKSKNEGKGDRAPRSDWPQVRFLLTLLQWCIIVTSVPSTWDCVCSPTYAT